MEPKLCPLPCCPRAWHNPQGASGGLAPLSQQSPGCGPGIPILGPAGSSRGWEGSPTQLCDGITARRDVASPRLLYTGVKNADEAELRLLASQPLDITIHSVQDFPQLGTLAGLLSRLICQKVQGGSPRRGPGEPWAVTQGQGQLCSQPA